MREKRKTLRIEEDHHIELFMVPEEAEDKDHVVTYNYVASEISKNGVLFATHHPIPRESFVRIDVQLKDGSNRTLSLSGVVRRSVPPSNDSRYRIGVEFFELKHDPEWKAWTTYALSRIKDRK